MFDLNGIVSVEIGKLIDGQVVSVLRQLLLFQKLMQQKQLSSVQLLYIHCLQIDNTYMLYVGFSTT